MADYIRIWHICNEWLKSSPILTERLIPDKEYGKKLLHLQYRLALIYSPKQEIGELMRHDVISTIETADKRKNNGLA
jgi:hypothetical protein